VSSLECIAGLIATMMHGVPCAFPLAGVFVHALARALNLWVCVCVCVRVYVDQSSTTSCCSSAYSKLGLKKRHQQAAAAAAVDSELVNASSSPAARGTPCDRFRYGCCHDSI
jgi:hypothetical protein